MLHFVLWLAYLIASSKVGGKQKPYEMWQARISLATSPLAKSLAGFARKGIWRLRRRSPAHESRQLRRLCLHVKCHYKIRCVFSKPNETRCIFVFIRVLVRSFIVKDFLKTFIGWDGYDTHLILWAIVSTRERVGYSRDSWNGLFFSRESWFH